MKYKPYHHTSTVGVVLSGYGSSKMCTGLFGLANAFLCPQLYLAYHMVVIGEGEGEHMLPLRHTFFKMLFKLHDKAVWHTLRKALSTLFYIYELTDIHDWQASLLLTADGEYTLSSMQRTRPVLLPCLPDVDWLWYLWDSNSFPNDLLMTAWTLFWSLVWNCCCCFFTSYLCSYYFWLPVIFSNEFVWFCFPH